MKKIIAVTLFFVVGLGLTACQIVDDNKAYNETISITQEIKHAISSSDENASYEIVTEVIPTNPKNVAVFDFGVLDILDYIGLDTLGIENLALVKSNVPTYLQSYLGDTYTNAGTLFEANIDNLDLFNPDLIIISSRSAWLYDLLKQELNGVAVLYVAIDNTSYLESTIKSMTNLKHIFNELVVFDAMIETLETKANAVYEMASISPLKALILMVNGNAISGYGVGSRFGFIHNELGFKAADENFGNGSANTHGDSVSFEYISVTNPDIIFVIDRQAAIGGEANITVLDNVLVNQTNAALNNHIISLDAVAWYIVSGGYQSTLKMIDDVKGLFA